MTEPIHCPCCNSIDTVSYWDVQDKKPSGKGTLASVGYIYRQHWPDRRICVDCKAEWNPQDIERAKALRKMLAIG